VRELSDADLSSQELADQLKLRQVIINTHSPLVVAELLDDELLFAETIRLRGQSFANFKPINGTWRTKSAITPPSSIITRGELHAYLSGNRLPTKSKGSRLVRDHLPETADLFQGS
jgi:hypothetical protein